VGISHVPKGHRKETLIMPRIIHPGNFLYRRTIPAPTTPATAM